MGSRWCLPEARIIRRCRIEARNPPFFPFLPLPFSFFPSDERVIYDGSSWKRRLMDLVDKHATYVQSAKSRTCPSRPTPSNVLSYLCCSLCFIIYASCERYVERIARSLHSKSIVLGTYSNGK